MIALNQKKKLNTKLNNYCYSMYYTASEKKDTKQDTGGVATKPKETQKPGKKFDFGGECVVVQ